MNIKRFYRWLPLFAALFSVAELSAQSQLVSFPSLRMTATEAMQTIEQQTGLTFSYNSAVFDTSSEVAFPATELSLEQAMSRIVKEKYLNFMFRGQYIIVYPDSAAKPAAPQPVNNRTSDVYEQTPANSRDTAPLRRPEVEEAPAPEPPAPIVRRVLAPGPDPSAFYSDYKDIDRFDRNGKHLPKWALKMNLLYAAGTLTPNLALEMGINDRMSVVLAGSYNPWNRIGTLENNDKIVHFAVHPQFRYWFCERFNGHFLSAGPFYNQFNVSGHNIPFAGFKKPYRYEGYAVGAGIDYGYSLTVAPRWNIEFTVGVGVAYMNYKSFDCTLCSGVLDTHEKPYFGPTNIGVNLVFLIK